MPRRIEPFASGSLSLLRQEAGLTQTRLAAEVGVSARQIANYEQGCNSPSPHHLRRMAHVLQTSPQVLAGVPEGEESLADLRRFAGLDRVEAVRLLAQSLPEGPVRATEWKLQALESGRPVSAWLEASVLESVVSAMAGIYGVPPRTVRRSWFRAFPEQAHLLRPKRPARARSDSRGPDPAVGTWNGLSRRQRAYLAACFREDQRAEDTARRQRAAGQDAGPAAQWRRVPFSVKADSTFAGYTGVQKRLRAEGWHDAGAGATLHALARRGLLRISEDQVEVFPLGFVPRVVVELTRSGRACARAGLGESPPRRPPGDLLSQWLWRTLVRVAEAGPGGLPEDSLWGRARFYLGTGYRPGRALSRGYIDCLPGGEGSDRPLQERPLRWVLTDAGRGHIAENAAAYQELYADVPAGLAFECAQKN
ncbi:helix-turn-helix domain-containing protein [Streptomyces sp. NBC_01715]|uniref:helix-turn-helix domain-containing protein n=1 Tax=Streptomyces sp. NBC_01715 TaxID=2975916 RepID=UPI002E3362AC|nr:helix-turn-helix domain-containing protein [Streptomyces sp. NBC_01715]